MTFDIVRLVRTLRTGLLWPAFAVCVFIAHSASAQSIDYAASEQLFGEPITTSVTGAPQRASDVPATMIIVTADEIRRSGATDIPGVLRHVAGVDVLQWHDADADVAVRGYNRPNSPRLLVLIDGRQVYADFFGYTPWSTLAVELGDIRQIEIVKGPSSALFGFNAVGGVINIVTYNPLYDHVSAVSLGVGTQSSFDGSVIDTVKLGKVGAARFSAGGRSSDDFSTLKPSFAIGTLNAVDGGEYNLRTVLRLGRNVVSDFEASTSTSDEPEESTGYTTYYARYSTKSVKIQLSADTKLGLVSATAYTNWIAMLDSSRSVPPTPDLLFNNQVSVAQLQDEFKLGNDHTFRASLEYRHNAMPTTTDGGQIFYTVASASGMWDWKITPSLALTNAVRLDDLALGRSGPEPAGYGLTDADWNGRSLHEPSYNTGLVWRPAARDTYRLIAAQGVQVPSLFEFGGLLLLEAPHEYVSGVPTLNPSVVTNFEVDYDRTLSSTGAELRLSAFHETTSNLLGLLAGSDFAQGIVATPATIGRSEATGLELSLGGTWHKDWRYGVSYTPEIIKDHFDPGFSVVTTGVGFAQTAPVHVAGANLGWAKGPWEADAYIRYESAFYGIHAVTAGESNTYALSPVPSYISTDARLGYKLSDRLTLAASGQNVLQAQQNQTSGTAVERRLTGSLKIKF